jgi:hypothetical protein
MVIGDQTPNQTAHSSPSGAGQRHPQMGTKWMPVFGHASLRPVFGVPAGRLFRGGSLLPVLRDNGVPFTGGGHPYQEARPGLEQVPLRILLEFMVVSTQRRQVA